MVKTVINKTPENPPQTTPHPEKQNATPKLMTYTRYQYYTTIVG